MIQFQYSGDLHLGEYVDASKRAVRVLGNLERLVVSCVHIGNCVPIAFVDDIQLYLPDDPNVLINRCS